MSPVNRDTYLAFVSLWRFNCSAFDKLILKAKQENRQGCILRGINVYSVWKSCGNLVKTKVIKWFNQVQEKWVSLSINLLQKV